MKKYSKILLLLPLIIIPLCACKITDKLKDFLGKEIIEEAIEQGTGSNVELNDDGGIEIETEDGTTAIGNSAEIPDNWPEDIPIIEHLEIISSTTYNDNTAETTSFQIMVQSKKSYKETKDYYTEQMAQNDWSELSSIDSSGTTMYSFEKNENTCGVWITEEDGNVVITITATILE